MSTKNFTIVGKISNVELEKRLVFGWASVIEDLQGNVVEDLQGDIIEIDTLEETAYLYVEEYRDAGDMHEFTGVGTLVESMVFSKEKQEALGIPQGILPVGWWIGFRADKDVFDRIKNGEITAFSIGGSATREEV